MIARLALRYLLVFALILAALSIGAYEFLAREYASLLQPALGTPEAAAAYRTAMARVTLTIVLFDVPLLAIVGLASWFLARSSLEPLMAARERERAFAADAAHELRSPLATIASVAQAARADAGPREGEAFETIARAALDASALVGELLTLARDATAQPISREPVDLGALVSATCKEFDPVVAERHLQLRSDPRSAIVDGDERRLRELTRNLLENAVRHARSSIDVVSRPNGKRVELIVSNDGEAVSPEMRERIFERFYRGTAEGEGSGLGLAIVRWIASAHGGEAFVRDAPSGGAEFVVRLPLMS